MSRNYLGHEASPAKFEAAARPRPGFLAIRCKFTADASAPTNSTHLGRSWDTSSTTPTPNGQAVIRESTIGAHVNKAAPWTAAATSGRAYSASGNRFYEYCNNGPGAAP